MVPSNCTYVYHAAVYYLYFIIMSETNLQIRFTFCTGRYYTRIRINKSKKNIPITLTH